jgi:hypothetical protein
MEWDGIEKIQCWPEWVAWRVRSWALANERFRVFLRENARKIRGKITVAKEPEDKADVLAELEFASCLLANGRFRLCYEPYHSAEGRGPDFLARAAGLQDFHVEVKRIRETEGTREIERFVAALVSEARSIPSSLGISVCILTEDPISLGKHLRKALPAAMAQCREAIPELERRLQPEEERTIRVPGLEQEVSLKFVKVRAKAPTSPTANFGGIFPVAYTQKEFQKFGDVVAGALGQLRPGAANVLAVKIDSTPHAAEHLVEGLNELWQQARAGKDEFFRRKGLAGAADFFNKLAALSAVVVKSRWTRDGGLVPQNLVWICPRAAVEIEDSVLEDLRAM